MTGQDDKPASARPIRSFGRRHGRRLRAGRRDALDRLLPTLTVPLPEAGGRIDLAALFPRKMSAYWLEIGFGAGEHLAWQAARHPEIGIIGCEPFVNGVSSLLHQIEENRLETVRIHPDDARPLIDVLPEASIGRCFLLFPDPWPKARHHRRRFVRPESLDALAHILSDGAEFRLASDDAGLVDWMLYQLRRHPAFQWTAARAADWRIRPADWPGTRYESKALHGRPVYMTFHRRPR